MASNSAALQSSPRRSIRRRQTVLPPGATRSSASAASRHPLPSLAAVMSAPERRNMPILHPERPNGALWFNIDDCMRKDILATYQSNFWGPWWTYKMVPEEKKDAWWTSFVKKYYWDPRHHARVRYQWETILKDSIRDLVSKRRSGKKPSFIRLTDWIAMQETWEEEPHQKRSKTNSKNASSNLDGKGSHRYTSGAKKHSKVAHEMEIEAGGPVPLTAVVRKTHTRKDGTCIDKRAESFIEASEALALERAQAASSEGTISTPSSELLNATYIETAMNSKGRIYGLGSLQYVDLDSNELPAASLLRTVEMDARVTSMDKRVTNLENDLSLVKSEIALLKKGVEMLLRMGGVDPVTYQPFARESAASAGSPRSEASLELNPNSVNQNSVES